MKKNLPLIGLLIAASFNVMAGEKVDKTLPINDASEIDINNLRGIVKIIGSDRNDVRVVGELDDKAQALEFEQVGSRINVKVKMPKSSSKGWGSHQETELTVYVPSSVRTNFNGVSSDVEADNLLAGSNLRSISGSIIANNLGQYIELSSVSGDIKATTFDGKVSLSSVSGNIYGSDIAGRLNARTVSGDIELSSIANEVFFKTVSGDIDAQLENIDEIDLGTVSGDIETQLTLNDDAAMKMSSVSGDFDLYFSGKVNASFNLSSNAGGSYVNKLSKDKPVKAKYGPSSSLVFDLGNASATVRGTTVSGTFTLKQK
ncbi:DUF4097 family beta strand repeat-containing protein [Thalassotalea agarivorans]|uniref:DUF4097 and DUF4098 domain-containing protein YvlB n=1 Tax=Thalassotalea agarivorans TaxID=349064 RepID=A0A1I0H272_THASX|nr:DUF4097 family beta strand repeat-containing protein [Thalassotalea agarivorans]SET77803.1 DUF4097 and DUF4098 domain-containing protein YvlB [Thalassotalea agarivorans]